jgi:hypothetical protein
MAFLNIDIASTDCQGNDSAIVLLPANSPPDLEQRVCGLLEYGGGRNCELASLPVRYLRLIAPTRYREL